MIVLVPAYQPDDRLLQLLRDLRHQHGAGRRRRQRSAYDQVFDEAAGLGARRPAVPREPGQGRRAEGRLRPRPAHATAVTTWSAPTATASTGPHDIERGRSAAGRHRRDRARGAPVHRRVPAAQPGRQPASTGIAFSRSDRRRCDTQTGLRGFAAELLPWLGSVPGERFEYELNQLLAAVREDRPIVRSTSPPSTSTTTPRRTSGRSSTRLASTPRWSPSPRPRCSASPSTPRSCSHWSRSPATSPGGGGCPAGQRERQLRRQPPVGLRPGRPAGRWAASVCRAGGGGSRPTSSCSRPAVLGSLVAAARSPPR